MCSNLMQIPSDCSERLFPGWQPCAGVVFVSYAIDHCWSIHYPYRSHLAETLSVDENRDDTSTGRVVVVAVEEERHGNSVEHSHECSSNLCRYHSLHDRSHVDACHAMEALIENSIDSLADGHRNRFVRVNEQDPCDVIQLDLQVAVLMSHGNVWEWSSLIPICTHLWRLEKDQCWNLSFSFRRRRTSRILSTVRSTRWQRTGWTVRSTQFDWKSTASRVHLNQRWTPISQ